jgi:hypothetical protein
MHVYFRSNEAVGAYLDAYTIGLEKVRKEGTLAPH